MKKIIEFFTSLRTSLWLLGLLLLLFFAGAVIMPGRPEFRDIHSAPLFQWLREQPAGATWWLWGMIGVLAILTVNTLLCSAESLVAKRKVTRFLLLISPQVIHAGFLFMLLAHLMSAAGASQELAVATEGSDIRISGDDTVIRIRDIDIDLDYYGYISDWKVELEYISGGRVLKSDTVRPNSPSVRMGYNINIKDLMAHPRKAVLLQINRDPGALWALTGGILFMAGIISLIILRIRTGK